MTAAERRCFEIAAAQLGLITRKQALRAGIAERTLRRRVSSGAWEEVLPGVYSIGPAMASRHLYLKAATLWVPGSAASHRFAGEEWELECVPPGHLDLTSPMKVKHPLIEVHRSSARLEGKTRIRNTIPITDVGRTLLDLGRFLSAQELELAYESALRKRLVHRSSFTEEFDRWARRGREGAAKWRKVLEIRDRAVRDSHTHLERRLMQLIRRSDLPLPRAQFVVRDERGTIARPDAAYPGFRIALEAQSATWHLGREAWQRDLERQTRLAAAGWVILYFTYHQIRYEPEYVIEQVRGALLARGWVPGSVAS